MAKITPFQQKLVNSDKLELVDVLREFADRLLTITSYPPIIPLAGQELHKILDEFEGAQNVRGSDEPDPLKLSDS